MDMRVVMHLIVALAASYALGSIPAAYIAGKSRGIDLRKHGSGNLGATNVFRVLGAKVGALVFAFDMAGRSRPAKIAMTAMTTSSSISVKPRSMASLCVVIVLSICSAD